MLRKFSNIGLILLLGLYYNSVPIAWLSYSTFAERIFAEHCVNPTKPSCNGKCQVMAMQDKAEKSDQSQTPSVKLPQFHPPLPVSTRQRNQLFSNQNIKIKRKTESTSSGIYPIPFHPPKTA